MNLKHLNTFGIDVDVAEYIPIQSIEQLQTTIHILGIRENLILGGGSNVLFVQAPDVPVLHIRIPGIKIMKETENDVLIEAGAGVVWHDLVAFAIQHGYGGIENLSLIPGFCGAAPMQNIGAYGVELIQVFDHLKAVNLSSGKIEIFDVQDCEFEYRSSVFKTKLKNQYAIASIVLKLSKRPEVNISYGSISALLDEWKIKQPSILDVSKAVIAIRRSKLPDPSEIGNAGSFFKNPVVHKDVYQGIKQQFPSAPGYIVSDNDVKVPAGWLIETCGWKGKQLGNTGTWKHQALVVVNYGDATGKEILETARLIRDDVHDTFNITLQPEVNLIGMLQEDF